MGINNDAVADHTHGAFTDHTGRQKAELVADTVDDERMASIVSALKAHHYIGTLRQPIHNLAFTFVAPLRPDDHNICHRCQLL